MSRPTADAARPRRAAGRGRVAPAGPMAVARRARAWPALLLVAVAMLLLQQAGLVHRALHAHPPMHGLVQSASALASAGADGAGRTMAAPAPHVRPRAGLPLWGSHDASDCALLDHACLGDAAPAASAPAVALAEACPPAGVVAWAAAQLPCARARARGPPLG